jgi:hypothetical protein
VTDLALATESQRLRVEMDGNCFTSEEALDLHVSLSLITKLLQFSVSLRLCGQREICPDRNSSVAIPNV